MRVHILDLQPDLSLTIDGTESWLDRIYADFPAEEGEQPRIVGELKLQLEEAGSVYVTGKLTYAPIVSCARCARGIAWPMSFDVGVRFLPEGINEVQRERMLSKAELDVYYLDGDEVDLETLVNDTIHGGLPSRLVATTDDGSSCRICQADLTSTQVFTSADPESSSPFAALRNLKLPN